MLARGSKYKLRAGDLWVQIGAGAVGQGQSRGLGNTNTQKGVLKNFAKFTGKNLRHSLF